MVKMRKCVILFIVSCLIIAIHAQSATKQLGDKIDQLNELSMRRSVIRLDSDKFNKYVKSQPRNYSMIVMFTALKSQRGCVVCKQASEEFTILANSYLSSPQRSSALYLAMVDYDDATSVFQSMKLNTAPVFMHFPAKGKPKKADTFEIHRYGFDAEILGRFVMERTSVSFRIFRPPNYMMNLMLLLTVALLAGLAYVKRDSLEFLFQRTTWAGITISFILVMMSGQMWNQIRGAAFAHRDHKTGAVSYIHGSSQGQFVAETYIVMMLHGAVTLGVILVNEASTQKNMDGSIRKVMSAIGLVLIAIFFSLILSIFRNKYGGYPYRFLF